MSNHLQGVTMKNRLGYKVPMRQVYCGTLWQWLKSAVRCHVTLRMFPPRLPNL